MDPSSAIKLTVVSPSCYCIEQPVKPRSSDTAVSSLANWPAALIDLRELHVSFSFCICDALVAVECRLDSVGMPALREVVPSWVVFPHMAISCADSSFAAAALVVHLVAHLVAHLAACLALVVGHLFAVGALTFADYEFFQP